MKYVVRAKKNPQDLKAPEKYYATAKSIGNVSLKEIAKEIEKRSSLSKGDIENVLTNLCDVIPMFLRIGNTVSLGDFGSFHLTLQSEGKDKPQEVSADSVKKARPVFVSGTGLKKELQDVPIEKFPEK